MVKGEAMAKGVGNKASSSGICFPDSSIDSFWRSSSIPQVPESLEINNSKQVAPEIVQERCASELTFLSLSEEGTQRTSMERSISSKSQMAGCCSQKMYLFLLWSKPRSNIEEPGRMFF